MLKSLSKTVLAFYSLTLLWLLLFKLTFDISGVLLHEQIRSVNLVPFASGGGLHEMISNVVVFVPLGLLLGINFKQVSFWRKLGSIFALSVSVEIMQYVLAIGRTDITDVITNTFGGLVGLALYALGAKFLDNKKLDWCLNVIIAVVLVMLILVRTLVLRVKY